MLTDDTWKTAIEDARYRHNAVVQLVYAADNQALGLLRLFVTVGLAAAAGAASRITIADTFDPLMWSLGAGATALGIAALYCLKAMASADINLPGRGAEFWLWAADIKGGQDEIFRQYLETLKEKHAVNNTLNERQTSALYWAKLGGALSPLVALLAAAFALGADHLVTAY